jgi:hydrogenase maturation protein HypF
MRGQVRNMGAFVQLIVTDEPERIDSFIDAVRAGKPRMADIMRIDREIIDTVRFDDFRIASSAAAEDEIIAVPADIAVCDECLAEFRDSANPRYRHPFISCTNCGPRYTIMERLPYDRDTTTMDDFPLCQFCEREYTDPTGRRYHAQTVSCHDCGPRALWRPGAATVFTAQRGRTFLCSDTPEADGEQTQKSTSPLYPCESDEDISAAIAAVKAGGVIALKGVGGYYFVCSPFDEDAVRRLRDIKVREHKPFAIMFGSVAQVRAYCEVNAEEEALLTSPKRPIVLLECVTGTYNLTHAPSDNPFDRPARRAGIRTACSMSPWDIPLPSVTGTSGCARSVIPVIASEAKQSITGQGDSPCVPPPFAAGTLSTSRFVGAFLPSMALQYLLVDALGPLIMTSANIANLPIIKDDEEMFAAADRDGRIAGVLYNERRIVRRLDDSVTRVIDGAPQLIRRSKGWTPVPIYVRGTDRLTKDDQIFAAGADLKSAFALTKGSFVYMSQYTGDMDNLETERAYEENLTSMRDFFGIEPDLIAYDMHPLYRTSDLAKKYAGTRLLPVQHHHAHIASVMAEHGLEGPVIGVAFDGTGYGTDGTIWGGEILVCEGATFERFSHLRTIEMIGGDASMRDGWKSALCRRLDHETRDFTQSGAGLPLPCCADVQGDRPDTVPAPDGSRHSGQPADGFGEYGSDVICDPAQVPAGESGPSEPFDIDLSRIIKYADENNTLAHYEREKKAIEAAVRQGVNTVRTSSMGRLFDAVASLLGIHHVNRYEGECAVMLENAAARALREQDGLSPGASVCAEPQSSTQKEPSPLCHGASGVDALALRFHRDVARAVLVECRKARAARGTDKVCLSGGVFQNKLLMEETLRLLRTDGFSPHYNKTVPPNDGGIAFGQAYIAMRLLR